MTRALYATEVLLLVVAIPIGAAAGETTQNMGVLASLAMIDYSQSVDMFHRYSGYHEVNPILRSNPSREELLLFGVTGIGITYLVVRIVPAAWKQVVVDSVIATERMNIEENRMVYQGWNTDGPPMRGRMMDGIPIIISLRY